MYKSKPMFTDVLNNIQDSLNNNQQTYNKAYYKALAKEDVKKNSEIHEKNMAEAKYEATIHNATEEIRTALYLLHTQPINRANRAEFIKILKRVLQFAHPTTIHQKRVLVQLSPRTLRMSMSVNKMCNTLYEDRAHTEELFGKTLVEEGYLSRIIRASIVGVMGLLFVDYINPLYCFINRSHRDPLSSILSVLVGIILGKFAYSKKLFFPKRNSKLVKLTRRAMKNKHKRENPTNKKTIVLNLD